MIFLWLQLVLEDTIIIIIMDMAGMAEAMVEATVEVLVVDTTITDTIVADTMDRFCMVMII